MLDGEIVVELDDEESEKVRLGKPGTPGVSGTSGTEAPGPEGPEDPVAVPVQGAKETASGAA